MSELIPPMMPDDLDALIQTMERVQQLEAEVARLRLTDEEREAIGVAVVDMANAITVNTPVPVANRIRRHAAELWKLLERTK
jgi:hypothetical protein